MDVKNAVTLAVKQIGELFEHEKISNLGLEEVEFDPGVNEWRVTIGFSRPWDYPQNMNALAALAGQVSKPSRSFKIVTINDNTGEIVAIKNRSTSG
jgi:hypothetical protein